MRLLVRSEVGNKHFLKVRKSANFNQNTTHFCLKTVIKGGFVNYFLLCKNLYYSTYICMDKKYVFTDLRKFKVSKCKSAKCHIYERSTNKTNYIIPQICGTYLRTAHLWVRCTFLNSQVQTCYFLQKWWFLGLCDSKRIT